MKNTRWLFPSLMLAALMATGCFLISGQFLVNFALGNHTVNTTGVAGVVVDLNTIGDYADHKEKLKGLADIAILGEFTNTGTGVIDVEVWMVDETALNYTTAGAVRAAVGAVQVWGPFHLEASETKNITWDASAALFGAGKAPLLAQIKGDGVFVLYAVSTAGLSSFSIANGKFIAVIDAGL